LGPTLQGLLSEDARDALVYLSSCENGFVVSQVQGVFANALSVIRFRKIPRLSLPRCNLLSRVSDARLRRRPPHPRPSPHHTAAFAVCPPASSAPLSASVEGIGGVAGGGLPGTHFASQTAAERLSA